MAAARFTFPSATPPPPTLPPHSHHTHSHHTPTTLLPHAHSTTYPHLPHHLPHTHHTTSTPPRLPLPTPAQHITPPHHTMASSVVPKVAPLMLALGAAGATTLALAYACVAVVPAGHVGIKDTFGKVAPLALQPGLHCTCARAAMCCCALPCVAARCHVLLRAAAATHTAPRSY